MNANKSFHMDNMSTDFEPQIVGFMCDWCSRITADELEKASHPIPSSTKVVGVPCSGRVDPLLLIRAYLHGADGVWVAGCQPGQCHFKVGNYQARRRMALLKTVFETLDLEASRFHIEWLAEAQARYIAEIAARCEAQIKVQVPNTARSELFI